MGEPRRLDLRSLLTRAEAAAPVGVVDAMAAALLEMLDARDVSFLIADFGGRSLNRLGHTAPTHENEWRSEETSRLVPLEGAYGAALESQRSVLLQEGDDTRVLAPVTSRGEAVGVLELVLPFEPEPVTLEDVELAAHQLAYMVIANRRYTDLFEWGQRTVPVSLAAEIQRRLLPASFTCEADQFTLAGWLEPAGQVGGDTFDFSLDRHTLNISMTDAMGHSVDSALLATLVVGALRNARRSGASLEPGDRVLFLTDGMLERHADGLDIPSLMLATGHLHPREAIQHLTHAVLDAVEGELQDDATSLCFDWHGGAQRERVAHAGAEHRVQRERAVPGA